MVSLIINGKPVCVPEGTSILEAARAANIDIPTLCYLKDLNEIGACRICMVEVEGQDTLVAACDNEVHEGMVVHTNSQKVRMTRRVNLQLLLSQHEVNCVKCTRSGNCKLQKLANDYNLLGAPYQKKLRPAPVDYSAPILRFENRCVKCMRCVQVCDKVQGVHIWDLVGTGSRTTVGTAKADSLSQSLCTYCGQCVTPCPRRAFWPPRCGSWALIMYLTPISAPTSPSWKRAASSSSALRIRMHIPGRCLPPAVPAGCGS